MINLNIGLQFTYSTGFIAIS